MDCEDTGGNPWASYSVSAKSPQRSSSKIIDNRFPNNFKKCSSLVTCNICQILILKNQTLHHFKTLHNKRISKKSSKFIIPYNAIEFCDLVCEYKTKKLLSSKKSNKHNEVFSAKKRKAESIFGIDKEVVVLTPKLTKQSTKFAQSTATLQEENANIIEEKSICDGYKIDLEMKNELIESSQISEKHKEKDVSKLANQNTLSNSQLEISNPSLSIDDELKLEIKIDSNGLFTSNFISESNIFDRISSLCDSRHGNDSKLNDCVNDKESATKQFNGEKPFNCTVFIDQHNNSIFIDNDKDESEDFDSSISNDSAYYSLLNQSGTVKNGAASADPVGVSKLTTYGDSSVAPPLVTACQFSSSVINTVSYSNTTGTDYSYSNSGSESQCARPKPSTISATLAVTRNAVRNSSTSTKSNVKHRFYVSSHGNQNMLESIRKNYNLNGVHRDGLLRESGECNLEMGARGRLHSFSIENKDALNIDSNPSSVPINQFHVNGLSAADDRDSSISSFNTFDNRMFIRQSLWNSSLWDCIHDDGIKNNLLIPKWLSWNYLKSRCKSIPQLHTKKLKYSSHTVARPLQCNTISQHPSISDNPLLSSYTIYSNGNDNYLQSDMINSSSIMLDHPFLDRNQMSFQQRLLERGVISQRDIARSQRGFSLNNILVRKNKSNSSKPTYTDCNRMLVNKNCSFKNQMTSYTGNEVSGSQNFLNKTNLSFIDSLPKDNQNGRSSMILDNSFDLMPNSISNNQRNPWNENAKLSKMSNYNTNVASFQGLCLSQNNKQNGTLFISSNNGLNTLHSHLDKKSESLIPNYKYQSDSSIIQINNATLNSQTLLSNDNIIFSQPFSRKYIHHQIGNGINRYNGCTKNFANHSTNVIHSNMDR